MDQMDAESDEMVTGVARLFSPQLSWHERKPTQPVPVPSHASDTRSRR
jgi:predicted amidophosphoribosyltransferase